MTQHLTDQQLTDIDGHLAAYRQHGPTGFACCSAHPVADAVPELLAEVRRLRTENERMRHELEVMYGGAFDNLPSAAVSAAVAPPTDQTAALERVRALHQPMQRGPFTICAHCSGWDGEWRCRGVMTDYPCPTISALPAAKPADRAALRERIAAAIYERNNPGYQWADAHPDDRLAYGFDADAVLAVLPSAADWDDLVREADRLRRDGTALHARAEELDTQLTALRRQVAEPTDRAAVLDLDAIAARAADAQQYGIEDDGFEQLVREDVPALITALRRMADETATETPAPSLRDQHRAAWHALTPAEQAARIAVLDAIDEPAAGARQDGAES